MDKEIESVIAAVKAELKTECAAWIEALQAELAEAKSACWNRFDFLAKRTKALEARCHELEHRSAASVQSQIAALQERMVALENERSGEAPSEVRYAPVGDHAGLWRCPAVNCYHALGAAWCRHGRDHERRHDCAEFCCCNTYQPVPAPAAPVDRCIPVPAQKPVVAIPDVPTPVGTEAFRREMASQAEFLSNAYGWVVRRMLGKPVPEADANVTHPERLAGVACAIRDAYDLARTGDHEAAQEKLEEIRW